jgi:endonuclease YncB( thermonuclease family)
MKLFTCVLLVSLSAFSQVNEFSLSSAKTLYIVDGDSISLKMRIKGIDTPEIHQTCQRTPSITIDCGQLAKQKLNELLKILPGKLTIKPAGFDYYQRILVSVYKGKVNIGKRMVEEGMAFSYKDTYKSAENKAKEQRLGFWGFNTPPIRAYKWRKTHRY